MRVRTLAGIGLLTLLACAVLLGPPLLRAWRGVAPVLGPPPGDIGELIRNASSRAATGSNATGLPLRLPDGLSIAVLARADGARDIEEDRDGNLWVSQPERGVVAKIEMLQGDVVSQTEAVQDLRRPHGLAFHPDTGALYVAEEERIVRIDAAAGTRETIYDLPRSRGGHWTRSLGFSYVGRLYVSIGSTCNVCLEEDERFAVMLSMNADGSDAQVIARGLRNAVFFTWHPDGRLFATDMGRDHLGDDLPPEEVNVIEGGRHYGWPYCYGNKVRDLRFRASDTFDCAETVPPVAELPAHMAPLGLAFVPASWPAAYRHDLLVAMHGSWNRSVPDGYKILRIPMNERGERDGPVTDFISGWLQPGGALGRPVDLLFAKDGSLFVTDDKAGVVYRVWVEGE